MQSQIKIIEQMDGQAIHQIVLTNDQGTQASFLSLGATWQSFFFPQADGTSRNLVLGHERPSDYLANGIYAGQTVGRVAGRIKAGQVTLSGQRYQLPVNNRGNTLHGGPAGLHSQIWDFELVEGEDQIGVRFTYRAQAAIDGFPGDMTVSAYYSLDNDDALTVTYEGYDATSETLFNPTNHVYFNLGDGQDVAGHQLIIASDSRLETDESLIPTGKKLEVTGTAYDFRQGREVMAVVEETGGLDDAFQVLETGDEPIAILSHEASGNQVALYSDRNALVVYSFNWPEEGVRFARSGGRTNHKHEGLALEAQTLPDAINQENFGNIILKAGARATYSIRYVFSSK